MMCSVRGASSSVSDIPGVQKMLSQMLNEFLLKGRTNTTIAI